MFNIEIDKQKIIPMLKASIFWVCVEDVWSPQNEFNIMLK